MMNRRAKRIFLAMGSFLGVAAGAVLVLDEFPGGMRSSYAATDGDCRLTREARRAVGIIAAVDRYRHDQGTFPADAAALAPYLPASSDAQRWIYHRRANGYTLWHKLGWDPSLRYEVEGERGRWVFDPGDGSPEKVIELHP